MKVRYKAALCCIEGGGLISGCSCSNPIHEYVFRETDHPLPGDEVVDATPTQGLDAKGLRALLQSLADAPHASYPGQLVKHVYASDCPTCIASHLLRQWPHATPSQRLDAATVEREVERLCAVRDETQPNLMSAYRQGVRDLALALATDPHQHGGKGA